jgi:hypothetical protein
MLHISVISLLVLLSVPDSHAFAPGLFDTRCFSKATISAAFARPVVDWYASETLESLLPKENALAIVSEILGNDALINDSEALVNENWEKLERKLRNETRTASEILGKETTDRILKSIQGLNEYDPQAVRAFLGSDAVNALFAKVLYDAIFEFFQRIDIFGSIINSLPILGPIRRQIVVETKKSLDRTLGPLVQQFLGTYTKIAVLEAVEFVLSPSNQKSFGTANVKLVSSLLERPVNSLFPPTETTDKLKEDAFDYLRKANMDEVEQYLQYVYDFVGDKSVDSVINVDRVLAASPTLQKTIDSLWTRALNAAESKDES